MTELEKVKHLTLKYKESNRVYTVYKYERTSQGFIFTLIYGSDDKEKVKAYTAEKEQEGKKLIVYCAKPQEQTSRCMYKTEDTTMITEGIKDGK